MSLFIFVFFYILFLTHPWYNTTALLLFLCSLRLALNNNKKFIFISGVLAGISFLTKQDFGFICCVLNASIILKVHYNPHIESLYKNFQFKDNKIFVIKFILFISGIILPIITCFLIFDIDKLLYWFNFGQEPHDISRRINIYQFLVDFYFEVGIITILSLLFSIYKDSFKLALSTIFIIISEITTKLSGLFFTHFYFVGFCQ